MITNFTLHDSTGSRDDQGNPVASRYRRIELAPYIEYGLTDRITIGAQPRYQWAESGSGATKQSAQGGGDIDVFIRHSLWSIGPWVTSAQATAVLPDAYDRARRPARGTGEGAFEARLLAGRNLGATSWSYFNLEVGYRLGQGGVADQSRFDSALGLRPWRHWLFLSEASLTYSLDHGDGAPGHFYDLAKARVSLVYFLTDRLGLQAGYERDVAGSGVSLGNTGVVAVWLQF